MAGKSADFDQNNASSFNFKLMFVNFNDGSLYPDVDLRKYGLESGKIVTNAMVQELCSIHPKIETLNLTHCSSVTDVGLWAIAKHLSLLRILNCYGCNGITTVGLRSLSLGCSNIFELDLSFCPLVDDVTLTVIAGGSWKIEKLSVEGCEKISDNGICKLAQGLGKSLTYLNLNRCPCIGEFGDRGLKELGPNCPNLVELYISNSKRVEDAGLLAISLGCLKLKKLSLAGCENITKKSLKSLTTNLINLQDLKIIKNRKLVDMDYSLLAGPKASNNFRTIDSFTASALLSPSLKLTILRLSQFETLTDKGVAIICATLAQQIRVLNLIECCLLTDYATFIIGQYCPELRELDLSYCKHFSDQCIVNMANKLKVLTLLKLDGNPKISTPCLLKYISNDSFEFVSMANNWLGYQPKPFVEKLIEQKRNLIIFHEKATKIQSIIRRKFADKIYLMKYREHLINKCIPMVQSIVRGYLQRKKYRKVLALKRKLVNVIKIQNQFRKYSATKKRKLLKKQKLFREYCHRLATIIQRFYRGHKGRVKVKKIRIDQANEILYKAQLEAQLEVQSIKIQRVYRGYKARCLAYQLYESKLQKMFRHRLEVKMRRIIQRVIRGKLGRIRAEKRRQEIAFYQYQWLCARNLQRVYRGHLGRLRFKYFLNLSIQRKRNFAATQIQRIYRGYRGKLLGAIAKSLRLLREKHQFYALEIQRFLRGCMGRHYFKLQKDIILQHKYREQAAIQIQRVFRGHKGREFREIEKAMQQMEGQAKPLMDHLRKCEKEAEEMRKLVKRLESMEQLLHKELFEIERELEHCMLTTNKYSDSSRINQTPQRFLTKFLRIRLKDHLEHEIVSIGFIIVLIVFYPY